jgi:foldase protein PrsA
MSDIPSDDQELEPTAAEPTDAGGADVAPAPRPVRRPRPAPAPGYVPGRRSRVEQSSGMNPIIVPIVALVALLALLGALIFDHYHKTSNTASSAPAATVGPTATPQPTPMPTATPITVATAVTTKAGVAAEVNGVIVPMNIYTAEVNASSLQMQAGGHDPNTGATIAGVSPLTAAGKKQLDTAKKTILANLIDTYLVVGYAKAHHLDASKKDVDALLNNYYSQAGGVATFQKQIQSEGFTMALVKDIVTSQVAFNNVTTAIEKTEKCPPCSGRHVRQILLGLKNKALAATLAKELQANHGATFAALAKKYSTDTATKSLGGDLGVVVTGQSLAEVDKAIFKQLKVGQISAPVKSSDGYHILEVLNLAASDTDKQTFFTKWIKARHKTATIHTYVQTPKS